MMMMIMWRCASNGFIVCVALRIYRYFCIDVTIATVANRNFLTPQYCLLSLTDIEPIRV